MSDIDLEYSVIDVLDQIENIRGTNAKIEFLQNHKSDLLLQVFIASLNPYVVYYVNKYKITSSNESNLEDDNTVLQFLELLQKLSKREITGNAAKNSVEVFMNNSSIKQQKWLKRILNKNLRCGIQEANIKKVWPNSINSFKVALANTLKSTFKAGDGIIIQGKIQYPVRIEPKLDGIRCIAIKQNGEVKLYTRNGRLLESIPTIKNILEKAQFDNIVFDGELMGEDWNESASIVMSSKTKKDDSNIVYNIFDSLTLNEWLIQKCETPYKIRCENALNNISLIENSNIKIVPHLIVNNIEELMNFYNESMNFGYEGIMIKTINSFYEFDRSDNILKLKPITTYEGIIVECNEGKVGSKREGQFGGFTVKLTNGITTRVGSGFNDVLRAEIQLDPNSWIGKIIEIEAQPDPMTLDGLSKDGKARFPVFSRVRDISDVDIKVINLLKGDI